MELHVELDNGFLPDAYAKYGNAADLKDGLNLRSFPFEVTDIPKDAQALAWIFLDWDSTPVCGFPWIHWCAWTRLSPMALSEGLGLAIDEDMSREALDIFQGYNSAAKDDRAIATGYVGPCPPDKDHVYTLHAVAVDTAPELNDPFWANELVGALRGHVLAEATIDLPSRS